MTLNLNGRQQKQLIEILTAAFPKRIDLAQMVRFGLNENLDKLTTDTTPLAGTVFLLVEWAQAHGRVEDLLQAALEANPDYPPLIAFVDQLKSAERSTQEQAEQPTPDPGPARRKILLTGVAGTSVLILLLLGLRIFRPDFNPGVLTPTTFAASTAESTARAANTAVAASTNTIPAGALSPPAAATSTAAIGTLPAATRPPVTTVASPAAVVPCLNGAVPISITVPANGLATSQDFVTSARCNDINLRFTSLPEVTTVRAVQCSGQGNWIGELNTFNPGDTNWSLIATNMHDGTCFHLEIRGTTGNGYEVSGGIAY